MEQKDRQFKMGSLFDGSGGFPLASYLCGIEPVWCSEIEPFPIKVTKARFPNMKHYGDISKIKGAELEPVDLVTGGSPCQDMSVAGKRQGMSKKCPKCDYSIVGNEDIKECPECGTKLEYTRSGLFMEQIRVIKEMREADELRQLRMRESNEFIRPRFTLWENVTGAFSSNKGEDFRAVLEETARIVDKTAVIPRPKNGKWHNAGLIMADGYSIAWRVLDAQYWGVPQRRRRIALVADFGGQCAGEILFKREGLQRNFTEIRHSWQNLTGCSSESVGETGECSIGFDGYNQTITGDKTKSLECGQDFHHVPVTMQVRCGKEGGGKGALLQKDLSATLSTSNMQTLFQPIHCVENSTGRNTLFMTTNISPTLVSDTHNHACCIPIQDQAISNGKGNGLGIGSEDDPMYSLMSETQHGICVLEGNGSRPSHHGDGYKESEIMYTLNATEQHAVAYDCRNMVPNNKVSATLQAKSNGGQSLNYINPVFVEDNKSYQHTTGPLMANSHPGSYSGQDAYNDMLVATEYIVRRLTPLECSRLQGFPDWWVDDIVIENPTEEDLQFWREVFETHRKVVTHAKKPKTDRQIIKWLKKTDNDGSKYKMWGNGIALPCFLYVTEGIKEVLERTSTKNH